MSNKGHSIANAQGFFLKHEAVTETETEIKAYAKEKVEIVNDFFYKKHQLNEDEKTELEEYLSSLESTRAIDTHFRDFVNARI